MSILKKTIFSILALVMIFGVSIFSVRADSDQDLRNFLESLITIGVIPAEKADLARTVLASALSGSSTRINRDLSTGSTGDDVKLLQKVLNTNPITVVASSGAGSSGNETTTFGPATKAAVIKFQNLYNFSPTGIVDALTRAKLNAILSAITNTNVPEAQRPSVDLKVNGQDDNVQIGSGGTATIMWTSTNVTSCVSGSNKVKPTFGTESVTNVTTPSEFVITCVGPGGIVSDSVTTTVISSGQTTNSPTNLVTLGSNNSTVSNTNILNVYINNLTRYTSTASSASTTVTLRWDSVGFTDCKGTASPTLTGFSGVSLPIGGSLPITFGPHEVGTETFTVACATGTSAVTTLNQSSVADLTTSTNLMVSSATLNITSASANIMIATSTLNISATTTSAGAGCDPGRVINFSGVVKAVAMCVGTGRYQIILGPEGKNPDAVSMKKRSSSVFSASVLLAAIPVSSASSLVPVVDSVSVANPSCPLPGGDSGDGTWYAGDTSKYLAIYTKGGSDMGVKVGDCMLGSADGNTDAICDATDPPIDGVAGISGGNVRGACGSGKSLVAGGVIREIGAGTCAPGTSSSTDPTASTTPPVDTCASSSPACEGVFDHNEEGGFQIGMVFGAPILGAVIGKNGGGDIQKGLSNLGEGVNTGWGLW